MPVENILNEYNQLATLFGILGGFAFAGLVQLISSQRDGKLYTSILVSFTTATMALLYALFAFVMAGSWIAEKNAVAPELDGMISWAFFIAYFGLILLLAGMGMLGWLRSKITGVITSILAILTFCMTLGVFATMITLSP